MHQLKPISDSIHLPQTLTCKQPWQPIYKFTSTVLFLGFISLGLIASGLLSGCGGSGSSSSSESSDNTVVNSLSQYVLPGELSAVPAIDEESLQANSITSKKTVKLNKLGISSFSNVAKAFNGAETDYSKAITHKFVEEPALEQFSVLEDVLTALNQTKYYEKIGESAYKAMVTMVGGGEGGKEQKTLEPWVVESDIVDANGNVVEPDNAVEGRNYDVRVRAWIEEEGRIIKGQFIIKNPPSQNEDGAYTDYGNWTLNVSFTDEEDEFFAASCSVNAQGQSVIKLHETMGPDGPGSGEEMGLTEVRAIMYRSETEGYGKVEYPNWEAVWGPDADPNLTEIPTISAKYAYNENYLAVQEEAEDIVYKDRTDVIDMTHRYGVFRYDNGDDVMKSYQFGFPFYYDDQQSGFRRYGYYGAWQGRHQIWMNMGDNQNENSSLEGLTVIREDHGSNASEETYTIGKTFSGTLVKRTYVDASLEDIKNIPVEIWVNKDYQLLWMNPGSGYAWYLCKDINWMDYPATCNSTPINFGSEIGFETLVVGEDDSRKQVNINGWDDVNMTNKEFVYLMANTVGIHDAGFYQAQQNMETWRYEPIEPLAPLSTSEVTNLWIWIGGSLYVEYKGEEIGWVEKEVIGFDEEHWMPEFGSNNRPFKLPSNNEIYINMQGASYVVKKDGSGNVDVYLELQTTLNPENAAELLPQGSVLRDSWDIDGVNTTYRFELSSSNPDKYLMLLYNTIGQNNKDQDGNPGTDWSGNPIMVGGVVQTGMWGLEYEDQNGITHSFNWEFSGDGGWGSVTYLMDENDNYVLLDDPIRFTSFDFDYTVNGTTVTKTLGLQYDGWMMGLPDLYWELERNEWNITDDIKNKIINLPAGTELESLQGVQYVLKPLEISQFLMPIEQADMIGQQPDITQADSVILNTVPDYEPHGMGSMPTNTVVEYSEGLPVE